MIVEILIVTALALVTLVLGLAAVVLTALTLPGIWAALIVVVAIELIFGDVYGWPAILICVGVGVVAEVFEFFASAAGAKMGGGATRGAIGATIGGVVGAIAGTALIPIPVVGTILGAALGAGGGAILFEVSKPEMTVRRSLRVGAGAASGRLAASIVKVFLAIVIALVLFGAVFVERYMG